MDEGRHWWLRLLLGIAGVLAGIAVIAWPGPTIRVLAALFALDILVDGGVRVVRAIVSRGEDTGVRVIFAVLGVVGVVVGAVLLANLPATVAALVLIAGLFWLVTGIAEIIVSLVRRGPGSGLTFAIGVLSLILGALVLAFPEASLGFLVLLIGLSLIAHGAVSAAVAIAYRRRQAQGPALTADPAPGPV
jgi:uncharacterized membrane protein HdeD (DUF308 family)